MILKKKIWNYNLLYIILIIKKNLVLKKKRSRPKKLKNVIKSETLLGCIGFEAKLLEEYKIYSLVYVNLYWLDFIRLA